MEGFLQEDPENIYLVGTMVYHEEEGKDMTLRLPSPYQEWSDVFCQQRIQALSQHSQCDQKIDLLPNTTPPFGPLYPCSTSELKAMKTLLDNNSMDGKIRMSNSPAASPILLIPKPDGSRLCVDYRDLNKIRVKDCYPLPHMDELRDRLGKARDFTKFDLKNGFHLLQLREGDQWKTAFRTGYGLYEYLIMPLGLCHAPSTL